MTSVQGWNYMIKLLIKNEIKWNYHWSMILEIYLLQDSGMSCTCVFEVSSCVEVKRGVWPQIWCPCELYLCISPCSRKYHVYTKDSASVKAHNSAKDEDDRWWRYSILRDSLEIDHEHGPPKTFKPLFTSKPNENLIHIYTIIRDRLHR